MAKQKEKKKGRKCREPISKVIAVAFEEVRVSYQKKNKKVWGEVTL